MPFPPALSRERLAPVGIVVLLLLVVFAYGVTTTRDLTWPGADAEGVGIDLYRDMALAQTMLDSGYGADPNYVGELTWYNPLVPGITAIASALTGADVPLVTARIGAFANLLAPAAFYLLASTLLGRWPGVYALAGYLFLMGARLPSWMSATYSPWFMPVNFAQAPFYLTVWAFVRGRQSSRRAWDVATGALWGVTFLAHTAPALVFGVMAVAAAVVDVRRGDGARVEVRTAAIRLAVMVILALAVSSPLLATVVGHYGLRTLHKQPGMYTAPLLARELPTLVWQHLSAAMFVATVGAATLWRQRPSAVRLVVFTWLLAAGLYLVLAYALLAGRLLAGWALTTPVPSFHFFFYIKAAGAVLFGVGITTLAARAGHVALLARWPPRRRAQALCTALVLAGAPAYSARPDFAEARLDALVAMGSAQVQVARWLRAHAQPGDVVLAADYDAAVMPGPAGVKVVTANTAYSNPYVDWAARARDRDCMYAALDASDAYAFQNLANHYRVSHVIARGQRAEAYAVAVGLPIEPVFTAGNIRVFKRK